MQNQQLLLQAEVISPRHLVAVVKGLLDSCTKNQKSDKSDTIQLALDRLAQSVQVAQSSGCLYGNTRKFNFELTTKFLNKKKNNLLKKALKTEKN